MAKKSKNRPDEGVVAEALDRLEESEGTTSEIRREAIEDIRFSRLNEQWPAKVRKQREAEGRPCLTINKMTAFIKQVVNDSRQNKPSITVVPVDGGADVDTAEVIGGLCRSIQQGSNADIAYDTALEHSVSGGFGFFRITTDYAHAESFDMEARIERIANPLSVHWDASTTKFDASDWEYGFVSEWLTKSVFEQRYPGKQAVSFEGDTGDRLDGDNLNQDSVRIAEYFLRTMHKRKIVQLSDGKVVREEDLKKPFEVAPGVTMTMIEFLGLQGITPSREREADYYKVVRRILSGLEVLEEADWAGQSIPICPVWGDEVIVDGRRRFRSLIRDARDPQMMFNFWRSSSTELVALAPRAPFIAQKGAIPQGAEGEKWRTANTRSHPYLVYEQGSPPPQRQPFPSVPAGNIQEALNASDDMKAIIGIYDASLGARSNETSGRAIQARQRESDTGTFHFIDNLARAIQYAGRVLIEIIPSIYSPRETIRILGEDMAPKVVKLVKQGQMAPQQGADTPNDKPEDRLYSLDVGKYDVVVKTGPSYSTQREQAVTQLIELVRSAPQAAPIIGDILVSNMDIPGAQEIAKRLKKMLPPQLQEGEGGQPAQPQIPPEIQQQIAQGTELIGQLQQENQQLKMKAQSDQVGAQVKMQELQLKAREMELRGQESQKEYEIKVAELRLKEAEILAKVQGEQEARAFEGQRMDREDMRAQQASQAPLPEAPRETDQGAILTASALQAVAAALEKVNAPRRLVRDPATGAAMGVELA